MRLVKVQLDKLMTVKSHSNSLNLNKAFTLIEIMIFVSLLSMVLIVAVGYVTRLLMNMKVGEHKIYATFYVEEVSEWLISERDANWNDFQNEASASGVGTTYCLNNNLNITDTIALLGTPNAPVFSASCQFTGITVNNPLIFRRTVRLRKNAAANPTQVTALIVVSWIDNGVTYTQQVENVYTAR